MGNKAIFLDRDGTIIIDKHYLHDPDQVEYFNDTFEAMKLMDQKGYQLFMVTNQSGIGRGMFKVEDMHKVHEKMINDLNKEGVVIKDVAFCPHSPDDNCECRKPSAQMIKELMSKHKISEGYMIGDKVIDAQAGINAGIQGVHLTQSKSEYESYSTLLEFAKSLP
ncbi:MAG: HAD family hydrolase [Bacteriovoracaceae bacterium]|nr:HAD family hydrolase [Bacteriovoracaceae bacterium]